jgi:ABC-type nitrate/sulfonate/bicarbonate transport system substrate-binding protein
MALRGFAGALSIAGLGLSDVRVVDVDGESRPDGSARRAGPWEPELEALRHGTVDAIYVKGAVAVEAAQQFGAAIVVDLDRFPDRRVRVNNGTPRPITVDQRVLDERPDVVARFLAVLLQAAHWARERPEPSIGGDLHPSLAREALRLLCEQHRFLRAQGFLPGDVDVMSWIDPAPLGAARDIVEARRRYIAEAESFVGRIAHPSSSSSRATLRVAGGDAGRTDGDADGILMKSIDLIRKRTGNLTK